MTELEFRKHHIVLSNGERLLVEEDVRSISIALGDPVNDKGFGSYICQITADGVLAYPNSGDGPEILTRGLHAVEVAEPVPDPAASVKLATVMADKQAARADKYEKAARAMWNWYKAREAAWKDLDAWRLVVNSKPFPELPAEDTPLPASVECTSYGKPVRTVEEAASIAYRAGVMRHREPDEVTTPDLPWTAEEDEQLSRSAARQLKAPAEPEGLPPRVFAPQPVEVYASKQQEVMAENPLQKLGPTMAEICAAQASKLPGWSPFRVCGTLVTIIAGSSGYTLKCEGPAVKFENFYAHCPTRLQDMKQDLLTRLEAERASPALVEDLWRRITTLENWARSIYLRSELLPKPLSP